MGCCIKKDEFNSDGGQRGRIQNLRRSLYIHSRNHHSKDFCKLNLKQKKKTIYFIACPNIKLRLSLAIQRNNTGTISPVSGMTKVVYLST